MSILDADGLYFSMTMELYKNQQSVLQSFKKYKKELLGSIITQLISQICGAQYVLYESSLVVEATGMSRTAQVWLVFICMVISFITELLLVDRVGPKILCLGSLFVLVVSQMTLGYLFGISLTKVHSILAFFFFISYSTCFGN